jgi:hypothetical protein
MRRTRARGLEPTSRSIYTAHVVPRLVFAFSRRVLHSSRTMGKKVCFVLAMRESHVRAVLASSLFTHSSVERD